MEINFIRPQVKTKQGIKTDKRLLNTKRAILSALIELLCTKSIADITVTELASKAGINRKTFYLHYDKTDDVIRDFSDDLFVFAQGILLGSVSQKTGRVDIKVFFSKLKSTIEENLEFCRVFVRSGAYHIFISSAMKTKYASGLRVYLASQIKDTALSPYIVEYMLCGVSAMYAKWLCTELPTISLDSLSERAYELVTATLEGNGRDI